MATVESARSVLFIAFGEVSKKVLCALKKDVKDFVCKWYPSLEVEVPAALLLHVTRYSIFSNSSIILPDYRLLLELHALIYSSHPFLCALALTQGASSIFPVGMVCVIWLLSAMWLCFQNFPLLHADREG